MQQVLRGSWPLYRASCHQRVQLLAFGCRYSHARLLCHESSKSQLRNDQSLSESRPNRAEDGKISLFGRIRQLGWTFWNGTKALMKDQKTAVQLALSSRFDQLNRKEKEFIRNAKSEVVKILPVLVLFCIPFIGYAAPILAFRYPRRFLSKHFLTAKQTRRFAEMDYKERSDAYKAVMLSTSSLLKEGNVSDLSLWLQGRGQSPGRKHLLQLEELFRDPTAVSRDHLVLLCKSRSLSTLGRPGFLLMWRLNRSVMEVCEDDKEMKREGVNVLTNEDIVQACKWRGLKTIDVDEQILLERLQHWLTLSLSVAGMSPINSIKSTSDVLVLAHAAVFTAVEHEQNCLQQKPSNQH